MDARRLLSFFNGGSALTRATVVCVSSRFFMTSSSSADTGTAMAQAWAPARAASKQAKEHYSTMWQCAAATQTQCNLGVRTGGEDKVKWCTGYALYGTAGSHVTRTGQAPCGGHAGRALRRARAAPPSRQRAPAPWCCSELPWVR